MQRSVEVITDDGVLFRQGEPGTRLSFVKWGEVTLTMKDGDKEIRIRAGNSSLLDIPALFGHQPCTMTAKATWDAEILKLSSRAFMDLLRADTRAEQTLLDLLAGKVRAARQAFLQLI